MGGEPEEFIPPNRDEIQGEAWRFMQADTLLRAYERGEEPPLDADGKIVPDKEAWRRHEAGELYQ